MFSPDTKILIVDDMLTMRKIVSKALKNLNFSDITECKNGNEAWETLQKGDFNLVISDWNMPECTGIELLSRVRGDQKLGETPFILLTAEAETVQVREALEKGVDNYIVKPFSQDTLTTKLKQTYAKVSVKKAA